jgi:hypothetical protein
VQSSASWFSLQGSIGGSGPGSPTNPRFGPGLSPPPPHRLHRLLRHHYLLPLLPLKLQNRICKPTDIISKFKEEISKTRFG